MEAIVLDKMPKFFTSEGCRGIPPWHVIWAQGVVKIPY